MTEDIQNKENQEDLSGWDYDEKPKASQQTSSSKKYEYDLWVSLKPNATQPTQRKIKIRFLSIPIHYGMHWLAFKPLLDIAKQSDPDNRALARKKHNPVKTEHYSFSEKFKDAAWSEGEWRPSPRHASWVIDRSDGHLKILEGSDDIFKVVKEWAKENKVNPVGDNGTDWTITVDFDQAGRTQIVSVLPGVSKPLTDDEKSMFSENKMVLEKILKIKNWKEIREMWMSLPDDKKYNPKNAKVEKKAFDDNERDKVLKRFEEVDRIIYQEFEEKKKDDDEKADSATESDAKSNTESVTESSKENNDENNENINNDNNVDNETYNNNDDIDIGQEDDDIPF
jgi:hypothetical protein